MKTLTPEEISRFRNDVLDDGSAHQFVGWMLGRAASSGIIAEEIRKLMGGRSTEQREAFDMAMQSIAKRG